MEFSLFLNQSDNCKHNIIQFDMNDVGSDRVGNFQLYPDGKIQKLRNIFPHQAFQNILFYPEFETFLASKISV